MKIKITGKELKATEAIKEYVEKKCERLQKYSEDEIDVQATIKTEGINQVAEISAGINGDIYRAVTENKDLYASIDLVTDKIERQIRKNKTKIHKKVSKDWIKFDVEEKEEKVDVIRRKVIDAKPMNEEEAILQMELLDHDFFVYKDSKDGVIKVVYKRKDKGYGVLEMK